MHKKTNKEPIGSFFSVVYEAKGMKLCTQVPKTCVHKRLVLDFHLFAFLCALISDSTQNSTS